MQTMHATAISVCSAFASAAFQNHLNQAICMIRKHQQLEGHSKSANFRKRYVIFLSLCSLCSPGDSSTFGGLPDLAIVS